jgi:hypothetical protein
MTEFEWSEVMNPRVFLALNSRSPTILQASKLFPPERLLFNLNLPRFARLALRVWGNSCGHQIMGTFISGP